MLPTIARPGKPITNDIPGLGVAATLSSVTTVKAMATYIGICVSLLKNGSAMKNKEIGMLK